MLGAYNLLKEQELNRWPEADKAVSGLELICTIHDGDRILGPGAFREAFIHSLPRPIDRIPTRAFPAPELGAGLLVARPPIGLLSGPVRSMRICIGRWARSQNPGNTSAWRRSATSDRCPWIGSRISRNCCRTVQNDVNQQLTPFLDLDGVRRLIQVGEIGKRLDRDDPALELLARVERDRIAQINLGRYSTASDPALKVDPATLRAEAGRLAKAVEADRKALAEVEDPILLEFLESEIGRIQSALKAPNNARSMNEPQ